MQLELLCPACGIRMVDFMSFKSSIMLAPNLALMQFDCPVCLTPLEVTVKLSHAQQQQLDDCHKDSAKAAGETRATHISYSAPLVVDAGVDVLQILIAPPSTSPEARSYIQEFHNQLEQATSVDEVLRRIDAEHRPPLL